MPALITTSRKPSNKTRAFCKDLRAVLPGSVLVSRGKQDLGSLMSSAREQGCDRVLVVSERHGNPGKVECILLEEGEWFWGPTLSLSGVKLIREVTNSKYSQFKDLSLDASEADAKKLIEFFGDCFTKGSELVLIVEKGVKRLSFHLNGSELGPVLKVQELAYEESKE